ncbi:ubiquinol-cytochrome-c reductase complex subunit-domain-containing protein [Daldinia bambusicola]|nr:ubiquinol-cytochrome-c reductase complex subunit-domain-containing protein [Daldinia bambusicola]
MSRSFHRKPKSQVEAVTKFLNIKSQDVRVPLSFPTDILFDPTSEWCSRPPFDGPTRPTRAPTDLSEYHYQPNVAGWTFKQIANLGFKAGAFGGVALFGVIYYASGIPRVREDILQKIPFIGGYFIKEIPASDNPF